MGATSMETEPKEDAEKQEEEQKDEDEAVVKATPEKPSSTAAPSSTPAASDEKQEPQKPKRPASAYWLYSNDTREDVNKELKEKNEGKTTFGDVAKEVSARWQALSESDRKVYDERAAADKERYLAEELVWKEWCDPAGALRAKYKHLMPKKPQSAFSEFCQTAAVRQRATDALTAAGQETGSKQISAKLTELWKASSKDDKAPYEDRYWQEHAEFVKAQRAWQGTAEFAEIEKAEKEQEENRRRVEAERLERERKESAKERLAAKKRAKAGKSEATGKESKDAKAGKSSETENRRPYKIPKHSSAPQEAYIDEKVLNEARNLNLELMLKNLASRPEIIASGKKSKEILEALKACDGLVNPAKRKLLG